MNWDWRDADTTWLAIALYILFVVLVNVGLIFNKPLSVSAAVMYITFTSPFIMEWMIRNRVKLFN